MAVILDTSALIDFLAGGKKADAVAEHLERGDAYVCSVSVFELFAGVQNARHLSQREDLAALCIIVPVTGSIARRAALIYTTLRKKGFTFSVPDLLIGAAAAEQEMPLLTCNPKDFVLMNLPVAIL